VCEKIADEIKASIERVRNYYANHRYELSVMMGKPMPPKVTRNKTKLDKENRLFKNHR
jgi:hypothetical protein